MANKKAHGIRNQQLSVELLGGKKYYDWVVTTAFYSVIHFVEDVILPCKVSGVNCKSINEVRTAYKMKGRHAARERLVAQELGVTIAAKYKWIDDRSRYSRYTTYKIRPEEAEKAVQYTTEIYNTLYPKS